MNDIRTPSTYFQQRGASPDSLSKLKGKLDDLLVSLYEYKERFQTTKAEEKILESETKLLEAYRYKEISHQYASNVAEAFLSGTPQEVVDAMWDALNHKIFHRVEPTLKKSGLEIEERIFWADLLGHK